MAFSWFLQQFSRFPIGGDPSLRKRQMGKLGRAVKGASGGDKMAPMQGPAANGLNVNPQKWSWRCMHCW